MMLGSYSIEGAQYCTICPAGKHCPDTNNATELPCPAGFYSFGGSFVCFQCPSGWKCPKTDGSGNARCLPVSPFFRINLF